MKKSTTEAPDISELRRHDLSVAIVVWFVALAALVESWRLTFHLPLPGIDADRAWMVSPGIFPLILSAGLLFMFSIVIGVSIKEGQFHGRFSKFGVFPIDGRRENLNQIVQISLLCLYVFAMLGRLHFGLATGLYLFGSMYAARAARWQIILIIAAVFSTVVTYLFGSVMKIPLP